MATHDYVIDNSTGANVRADINSVLQAILTNNSSSSAPSTTAAYMWWADTTNGVLKIRNSANNDWVELLQLDGTLTLEDGSASTPALAFRDDLNTGIFSSAADTFNVATGGVERMELGAATVFNEDGADVDFRIESDTKTHMFFIDSGNNRIGINSSSPTAMLQIIDTATSGDGVIEMFRLQGSGNNNADGQQLSFARSGIGITAAIQAVKNETAANETDIRFSNMTAGSLTEKARIDGNGRLLLGTTTKGQADADDFTVANSGSGGITIRTGTSSNGNLFFSDATSGDAEFAGYIQYKHSSDRLDFGTATSTRMTIDSSGRILAGVTSARTIFKMGASGNGQTPTFQFETANDDANNSLSLTYGRNNAFGAEIFIAKHRAATVGGTTVVQSGDRLGGLTFAGSDGTNFQPAALIQAQVDGTPGANDMPGRLVFSTTADGAIVPTERMRIDSSGRLLLGQTSGSSPLCVSGTDPVIAELHHSDGGTNDQARISLGALSGNPPSNRGVNLIAENNGAGHDFVVACSASHSAGPSEKMRIDSSGNILFGVTSATTTHASFRPNSQDRMILHIGSSSTGSTNLAIFSNPNGTVGSITTSGSATSFNTSSDYRLKENVVAISDGITRLKTLKPSRFNFIADAETTVDGFLAHEVTAVPEAITGTKDEVDSDNKPVYQGIDQSKLVPLLTAALQEAVAKIEVLETKVAALEAA